MREKGKAFPLGKQLLTGKALALLMAVLTALGLTVGLAGTARAAGDDGGNVTANENVTVSGYVITIGDLALSSKSGDNTNKLVNNGGAYIYTGLEGVPYTAGTTQITSDILWQITPTDGGYLIQSLDPEHSGEYLSATYKAASGSATTSNPTLGDLFLASEEDVWKLDGTFDAWTGDGTKISSKNSSSKYLTYYDRTPESGNKERDINLFTIGSKKDERAQTTKITAGEATVTKVDVTDVTLNKTEATLVAGKTITLTATVVPNNATDKSVTWTSSNKAAATVSNGVVTGVAEGEATITATTVDGGKTATCKVTVTPKPPMTAYALTDDIGDGEYLIVSSNTDGDAQALTNNGASANGTDAAGTAVRINKSGNNYTVETDVSEAVWTISKVGENQYRITNDGGILGRVTDSSTSGSNSNPKVFSSEDNTYGVWSYDKDNSYLTTKRNASSGTTYYLRYSSNAFSFSSNTRSIYLYKKAVPATAINVTPDRTSVEFGKTVSLSATVDPADTSDSVVWTSDKPEVAKVDKTGKVYGIAVGKATITATAGSVSDTCEVTVTKRTSTDPIYAIVIDGFALSTIPSDDQLVNSGSGSQKYYYTGLAGKEFADGDEITGEISWTITDAGDGYYYIKSLDGSYLRATYESNSTGGNSGVLSLSETADKWQLAENATVDSWMVDGSTLTSDKAEKSLTHEEGTGSNKLNFFTVRSTGENSKLVGVATHTVSFVTNCEQTIDSQTVEDGATATKPTATLTKEGYTFDKWCSDEACEHEFDFTQGITEDTTIYAKWTANSYSVKFNKNNNAATGTMNDQAFTYGTAQKLTKNAYSVANYSFAGWATSATGDVEYSDEQEVSNLTAVAGGSVELFAKWTQNPQVDVTFMANDGTETTKTQTIFANVATALEENAFTREGYDFTGWNTKADGSGTGYTDKQSVTIEQPLTLYAQWKIKTFTVVFYDEDGTTPLKTAQYDYGTKAADVEAPTPTKEGTAQYSYSFDKWTPAIADVTADAEYVASYTQTVNKYTVTFYDEDGKTVLKSADYDYGTKAADIEKPTNPTKEGNAQYSYTFNKWTPDVADVTAKADYTASYTQSVNKYEITWKDGDGKTLKTEQVEYGKTPAYTGTTPTKAKDAEYKYTFNGTWSPEIVAVAGAATYTAQFDATPTADLPTVTYVLTDTLDGGKKYLIATSNDGNGFILSSEAGTVDDSLKGCPVSVENGKIAITEDEAATTVFNCVQDAEGNAYSTVLMMGTQYLYADSNGALRLNSSKGDGKYWHYIASDGDADKNLLWFFQDSKDTTTSTHGYTWTGSTYRYYLEYSDAGDFTKGQLTSSTTSLKNTSTPKIYLFTEDIAVTGVTLDKTTLTDLEPGDTEQLTATVAPANAANKGVTWTSSDEKVAKVDQNGLVTAVADGSATITVTTKDGGQTATCTVTVKAAKTVTYKLADKLEADKEYLIANGKTGSVSLVTNESGGSKQLKSVAAAVDGEKITITEKTAAKTTFKSVANTNSAQDGYWLTNGNQYLYADSSSGLRLVASDTQTSSDNNAKSWHYKADNKNLLWFFKDTADSDGYTDTSSAYKYYIEVNSAGNFADNHVSTTSLADSTTPAIYLFVKDDGSPQTIGVDSISLSESTLSLEPEGTATLTVTFDPEDATNQDITWTSSDPNVATVEDGVVTAVGAGTATITATSADNPNAKATCAVTVTAHEHTMTKVEATEPTCTEAGNSEYYACSGCGKFFSDAEGKNEIEESSWTIPATGHQWGAATYTWAEDNSTVTASHTCSKCTNTETEIVETSVVTKPATCEEEGETKYTAEFKKAGFVTQTKTKVIKALGHSWGEPEWTWAEDNTAATATFTCYNDKNKDHVVTSTATVNKATSGDRTTYTASVTGPDEKQYTDIKNVYKNKWGRLAGNSRYATMSKIVSEGFDTSYDAVLATGKNFPDALVASSIAGTLNCPVILTDPAKLSSEAETELKRLKVGHVYVMGSADTIKKAVTDKLSSMRIYAERIEGKDRQLTSLDALKKLDSTYHMYDGTIVIASGFSFPDALAIGPWCYRDSVPILLAGKDGSLNDQQWAAIRGTGMTTKAKKVIILGGEDRVNNSTRSMLKTFVGNSNVTELAGASRYETAAMISEWEISKQGMTAEHVTVAKGTDFPDALAGAALVGKLNSVLLLANNNSQTDCQPTFDVVTANKDAVVHGYVLGDENSISAGIYSQLNLITG